MYLIFEIECEKMYTKIFVSSYDKPICWLMSSLIPVLLSLKTTPLFFQMLEILNFNRFDQLIKLMPCISLDLMNCDSERAIWGESILPAHAMLPASVVVLFYIN